MSTELATVSGNSLATTQNLGQYLNKRKSQIQGACRNNLNGAQVARTVLREVGLSDRLQKCTCHSIYQSLLMAVELGLQVGSGLGEAYLLPFKDTDSNTVVCTFVIGYKGVSTLAYRSGIVEEITMVAVYEGDEFEVNWSQVPPFKHKPDLRSSREDKDIWAVYCLIRLRGSVHPHFEFMNRGEIEKVRNNAPSKNSPAWRDWFGEMAKKTVLKRACKPLPKSPDLSKAIAWDSAVESRDYTGVVPFEADDLQELPMLPSAVEPSGSASVDRAASDAAVRKAKAANAEPELQMSNPSAEQAKTASTSTLNEIAAICVKRGISDVELCKQLTQREPLDMTPGMAKLVLAHLKETE